MQSGQEPRVQEGVSCFFIILFLSTTLHESNSDASNEEGNINVPVLAGLTPHLEMTSLKHNVLRIHSYILLICSI